MSVSQDGDKRWWNTAGRLHRLDGPAYEGTKGSKAWYVDGKCHRIDGPAVDYNNFKEWYINGEKIPVNSQQDFEYWLLGIKI